MNVNSYATKSAKASELEEKWHLIDADGAVVGRLASVVASILRGKMRPDFTPHVDMKDHVVIINADKARFTGNKENTKEYFRHTGYPGGDRFTSVKRARAKKPTFIVENAVKGMLPKTKLGSKMYGRLKVYAGGEHPHEAQSPQPFKF